MQAVPVCCQCDVSCAAGSTAPAGVFLCLRKVQTTRYIPTLSTPPPRSAGLQVKYHKCFANTLPSTWHNYPDSVQPVQPVQCCWSSQRITSWWFLRVTVDSWRSSTWLELVVNIITDQLLTPAHHSHLTLHSGPHVKQLTHLTLTVHRWTYVFVWSLFDEDLLHVER